LLIVVTLARCPKGKEEHSKACKDGNVSDIFHGFLHIIKMNPFYYQIHHVVTCEMPLVLP